MSKHTKYVFLADIFIEDYPFGGGEKSNEVLYLMIQERGNQVTKRYTYLAKLSEIVEFNRKKYRFIIANFIYLSEEIKKYLATNCQYIIIEHDHKYLFSRNPSLYKNFLAPKDQIINFDFYAKAKAVIAQSKLHREVIEKNLKISNIKSLGGNFWSDDELDYIADIRKDVKLELASIPNFAGTLSKGTDQAILYCQKNELKYELIQQMSTKKFLSAISKNKYLVFIPRTLETLSRIVIEASMLDVIVKTYRPLIGACSEPWWGKITSIFLVNYMKEQKSKFLENILSSFDV